MPTTKSFWFDDRFYAYLWENWVREPEVLARLREETSARENAQMQISAEQGQFMAMMVKLIGAKRYLEVGVFTGYSSLAVALALPNDGQVVACDVSEEYTGVARRFWREAGLADRIDLRIAPAAETLESLIEGGRAGSFDMMFIDADKGSYPTYIELGLKLLRSGGLMLIDNVFWDGRVADPENQEEDTIAIRSVNAALHGDERVDVAIVPIGDGLTLARKR